MKKHGILNSEISKVLADLGHTDQVVIADCGLPVPAGVAKIDLALKLGQPSFIEVLDVLLAEMAVEKVVLAQEINENNPSFAEHLEDQLEDIEKSYVTHEEFKEQNKRAKVIIRTGEATPYANIILQAGVIF